MSQNINDPEITEKELNWLIEHCRVVEEAITELQSVHFRHHASDFNKLVRSSDAISKFLNTAKSRRVLS